MMIGKNRKLAPGVGMAIGIAIGAAIGLAMDSLAIGIGIGVAIGAGIDARHRSPLTAKGQRFLVGLAIVLLVLVIAGILIFFRRG